MTDPYVGEIIMLGENFAPRGYVLCDGQTLVIEEYPGLYALIGTTYGGDGQNTFNLPDLRSRVPVGLGQGNSLGLSYGTETVALGADQMPSHSHGFQASSAQATSADVNDPTYVTANAEFAIYSPNAPDVTLASDTLSSFGTGTAPEHDNMMPFQVINFAIAVVGRFPED